MRKSHFICTSFRIFIYITSVLFLELKLKIEDWRSQVEDWHSRSFFLVTVKVRVLLNYNFKFLCNFVSWLSVPIYSCHWFYFLFHLKEFCTDSQWAECLFSWMFLWPSSLVLARKFTGSGSRRALWYFVLCSVVLSVSFRSVLYYIIYLFRWSAFN